MSAAVKLSDAIISEARIQAKVFHRSTASQIEHWSQIGKMSEENPDLAYKFIKDVLLGLEEVNVGKVEPYKFG